MKANYNNVNEELLVKYLLGEANEAERDEVNDWINASEENKKYYEHFTLIWNESKKIEATSTVNVEDAWMKFKKRTEEAETTKTRVIEFPAKKFSWVKAAAVLVLVAGAGWMAYTLGFKSSNSLMAVNSGNAVLVDTLPDGSVVTLNKNSSLTYSKQFDGAIRAVKLQGEAFFNVAPDKTHPFVIDVNGTTVTVVGTAFNVKSTEEKTEVVVESGIVEVAKNQNAVRLNPNEKATVLATRDAPIKGNSNDELYNYYKTNIFDCTSSNASVSRLVDVLEEVYGVDIVIENDAIANLSLNTKFDKGPLDDVMKEVTAVIQKQYPQAQVSKEGGKYILQ